MRLEVLRTSYGPDMIARNEDGKTVFVAGAVPGDHVEASITSTGKAFDRARVERVLEPSALRVQSPCPYAGVCGGCPWASIERSAQLEAKRANVVDSLTRIAHLDAERADALVGPCQAPSDAWGYRNKVELAFSRGERGVSLGMHGAGGHGIVRVDRCLLMDKRYQKLPKSVAGALSFLSSSDASIGFERIGIRASVRTHDVEVALWTAPGVFPRARAAKILGDATRASSVVRVLQKGTPKARKIAGVERLSGAGSWSERIDDGLMRLSAPSFFQVNTKGADALVRLVLDGLAVEDDEVAMDLYCGAGTFTLPLAKRCAWVSAVESYGPAVRDLRRNLDAANLTNVEAIGGDAAREFPDDADVIVVDPPRAGLGAEVVGLLSDTSARAIAYVSCDPATLARDLGEFKRLGVFAPRSVTPVDLFPQTYHVETVTLLTRDA